jgi:hypothetical protein
VLLRKDQSDEIKIGRSAFVWIPYATMKITFTSEGKKLKRKRPKKKT